MIIKSRGTVLCGLICPVKRLSAFGAKFAREHFNESSAIWTKRIVMNIQIGLPLDVLPVDRRDRHIDLRRALALVPCGYGSARLLQLPV
jgi:hypothetical protein